MNAQTLGLFLALRFAVFWTIDQIHLVIDLVSLEVDVEIVVVFQERVA